MKIAKINYNFSNEEINTIQQILSEEQTNDRVLVRAKVIWAFIKAENGIVDIEKLSEETGISSTTIFRIRSNLLNNGLTSTLFHSKKYNHQFTSNELETLNQILSTTDKDTLLYLRASILLKLSECEQHYMTSDEIAVACNTSSTTVKNTRASLSIKGFEETLYPTKRKSPPVPPSTDSFEDKLLELLSTPPKDHKRWTIRLLADTVVELGYIDSISYSSIARFLKRKNIKI